MMEKLIKKLNNRKGFTLIELIVVIAIIGILAAILIPQFTGFQDKAKSTQATVEAKQVATAGDAYIIENSKDSLGDADRTIIAQIAGVPSAGAIAFTGDGVDNGRVVFTYTIGKYQSVRDNTGKFTTTITP